MDVCLCIPFSDCQYTIIMCAQTKEKNQIKSSNSTEIDCSFAETVISVKLPLQLPISRHNRYLMNFLTSDRIQFVQFYWTLAEF